MKTVVVFIHGIGGSRATFGKIDTLLASLPPGSGPGQPTLAYKFFTYDTPRLEDPASVVALAPDIQKTADLLATRLRLLDADYDQIFLVTHSQGGLIALRAVLDMAARSAALRVSRILNIATPHQGALLANIVAGLGKATRLFKALRGGASAPDSSQIQDLAFGSNFLFTLHRDWANSPVAASITLRNIIASRDYVVPAQSAHFAGASEDYDVIDAGHTGIFEHINSESPVVRLIYQFITHWPRPRDAAAHNLQPYLTLRANSQARNSLHFLARATTPFEREADFTRLERFLDAPAARFSWTILSGPAGVGKSRFALEAMLAASAGWAAGFLEEDALKSFDWNGWQPLCPTLLCIDYASRWSDHVRKMIDVLTERALSGNWRPLRAPVRLLLIERKADALLYQLFDGGRESETAVATFEETHAIVLRGLQQPKRLVDELFLKQGLDREVTHDELARLHTIDPALRPLFVMIFAEILIEEALGPEAASLTDRNALVGSIIKRWRNRFWNPAGLGPRHQALLAAASITGHIPYDSTNLPGFISLPDPFERNPVFEAAGLRCTPDALFGLEPDLIGEFFALDFLASSVLTGSETADLIATLSRENPAGLRSFVNRAAQDFPDHPALGLFLARPKAPENLPAWAAIASAVPEEIALAHMSNDDWIEAASYDLRQAWWLVRTRPPAPRPHFTQAQIDKLFAGKSSQIADLAFETHLMTLTSWTWRLRSANADGALDELGRTLFAERLPEVARFVMTAPFEQILRFLTLTKINGLGRRITPLEQMLENNTEELLSLTLANFPRTLPSAFQAAFALRSAICISYSFTLALQSGLAAIVETAPLRFLESPRAGDFSWLGGYLQHLPFEALRLAKNVVAAVNTGQVAALPPENVAAFLAWVEANLPLVAMSRAFHTAQALATRAKAEAPPAPARYVPAAPANEEDLSQPHTPPLAPVERTSDFGLIKAVTAEMRAALSAADVPAEGTLGALLGRLMGSTSSYLDWVLYYLHRNQPLGGLDFRAPVSEFLSCFPDGLPLPSVNDPFTVLDLLLQLVRALPEPLAAALLARTSPELYGCVAHLKTTEALRIPDLLQEPALPPAHRARLLEDLARHAFRIGAQSITRGCGSVTALLNGLHACGADPAIGRDIIGGFMALQTGEQLVRHHELGPLAAFFMAGQLNCGKSSKINRRKKILGASNFPEALLLTASRTPLSPQDMYGLSFFLAQIATTAERAQIIPALTALSRNSGLPRALTQASGGDFANLLKSLRVFDPLPSTEPEKDPWPTPEHKVKQVLLDRIAPALGQRPAWAPREYVLLSDILGSLADWGHASLAARIATQGLNVLDPVAPPPSPFWINGFTRILSASPPGPALVRFVDQLSRHGWFLRVIQSDPPIDIGVLLKFPVEHLGLETQSPAFVDAFIAHVSATLVFTEPWHAVKLSRVIYLLGLVDPSMQQIAPLRAEIVAKMRQLTALPDFSELAAHNANWGEKSFARGLDTLEALFLEACPGRSR